MLKVLLKKQLMEIFRSYFYDAKKNRGRSKVFTVLMLLLYALIIVGFLGGMFAYLSFTMCGAFCAAGVNWLYFTILGLIAIFLGVFGSVFNTYAGLYLSKDNDLLLSMPIPAKYIVVSRLLGVYLMGLIYSASVTVPAVIVYWITVKPDFAVVICGILFVFLVSVFVLILSCLLGWVVAKISLKLKNKSFITVLISLVFIGAYYFFYFKAQSMIQDLLLNAALYGEKIRGAAYGLYLFGQSGTGDWIATLICAGVILALFAVMWIVLERSFLSVATSTGVSARAEYREKKTKRTSPDAALLRREFARFTSSPNYMLNCGLGVLMLPLGGVALLIKGRTIVQGLESFGLESGVSLVLLCAACCMISTMIDTAAPSVSLEGKNLWVVRSMPVSSWQVLRAKLRVNLLLAGVPMLFCAVCASLILNCSAAEKVLFVAVCMLGMTFLALWGLFLGVSLPNLEWTNEIYPIKQGGAVTFALFGGWGYALLVGGLYFAVRSFMGPVPYLASIGLITAGASFAIWLWLKKRGAAKLETL